MKNRAFTLLELATVITLVAIGATAAVVSMRDVIANARLNAEAEHMVQRIQAEQRSARERHVALRFMKQEDPSPPDSTDLVFQDVANCRNPQPAEQRVVHFPKAVDLRVTQGADPAPPILCWEASGALFVEPSSARLNAPGRQRQDHQIIVRGGTKNITLQPTVAGPLAMIAATPPNE